MTDADADTQWQREVEAILAEHIGRGATITYGGLADAAAIPPPQRIHRLTDYLETLMERDVKAGGIIRAANVVSRTTGKPARGFYEKLATLGLKPDDLNPDNKAQD